MSAPVDVLAVMQRAGRELECLISPHGKPMPTETVVQLAVDVDEARAAVAELIEAARKYEAASGKADTFREVREARNAVFAALARVSP